MARKSNGAGADAGTVPVRVLVDCAHGHCNDVADLPVDIAQAAAADGLVDLDPAAVEAARSLAGGGE